MTKKQKILSILLGAILVLSVVAATYAYFTASVNRTGNTGIVEVTTTELANLTMTSMKSAEGSPIYPGWVGYQGIEVHATGNGNAIYDLSLEITGGSNVKGEVQVAICKKENQTTALASNEFTFAAATAQVNTSVTPPQYYMSGGTVALPSGCTEVVGTTTLSTLGASKLISAQGGKAIEGGKYDKYYIIYNYQNNGDQNSSQGENFTITPVISARGGVEEPSDPSGANAPKLVTNLIPVVYDEGTSKWKMSETTPTVWYDYSEQKWANAVTVTSAKRGTYSVGDTIEMSDILGMWVWIPRYEYKYTNLGTSYAGGTQMQPGGIDINFISGTSTTETSGYIIHPAFRDASSGYTNNAGTFSAYQIGGWDSELTGFWMGKFETGSVANASSTTSSTDTDPIVKPNVIARKYQTVYHQYSTAQNIGTYHGISTLDTHMGKNSEWGAVAYLSQSTYGKYGNSDYSGANKEVYFNNSSDYYTGRSMGAPASSSGSTSSAGTYEYNVSQNGTGASTTGNIYGIYDMAGGSFECVMGWLSTASSNFGYRNNSGTDTNDAGFSSTPSSHKYWDEYTTTTVATACGGGICYGHGLSETEVWYGDYRYMLTTTNPWFLRSGYYEMSFSASGGTFVYSYYSGYGDSIIGSRAVLV